MYNKIHELIITVYLKQDINEYYQKRLEKSLKDLKRIIAEARFQNFVGEAELKKEWERLYKESQLLLSEYDNNDVLGKVFVENFCHMALGLHYEELELDMNSKYSNVGWYGCY